MMVGYCCETCHGCLQQCMVDEAARTTESTTTTTAATPTTTRELDESGLPYYPIVLERASDILGCVTTKDKYYRW
jgi:hypothetical protein